jgi:peptide/nickel transport system substrate-binding protein
VQDPYASFALFHSRESAPTGQRSPGVTPTRFADAAFDQAVDTMATLASTDPNFSRAADTALAEFTRLLPAIPLVQARLLTPFNKTYWTDWPSADNNYFQPGHWWISGDQLIIHVKPVTR